MRLVLAAMQWLFIAVLVAYLLWDTQPDSAQAILQLKAEVVASACT